MKTLKSYTDIEQSKELAKILPIESADMFWYRDAVTTEANPRIMNSMQVPELQSMCYYPCWSLSALLDILPYPTLDQHANELWSLTALVGTVEPYSVDGYDNKIDACVEMIIKLNEQKLL